MKKALVLAAILGASPAFAASSPYYVGENLTPTNHINLNFADTPVKNATTGTRGTSNNLVALDLRGAWNPMENTAVRTSIPFYFANKGLVGTAKNTTGNISLGGAYALNYQSDNRAWTYGPTFSGDVYLPTSRKIHGSLVGAANPTTDFYKFLAKATSFTPTLGFFAKGDMFSTKANIGYGGVYITSPLATTGSNKKFRSTFTTQLAASYHVLPNFHLNAEYNSIWLDKKTKVIVTRGAANSSFRHAISPSVSGNWEQIMGSVFATIPLDSATRKATNVAFGANAGYMF